MVQRAWEKNARMLGTDRLDVWLMGWVRGRWHLNRQDVVGDGAVERAGEGPSHRILLP